AHGFDLDESGTGHESTAGLTPIGDRCGRGFVLYPDALGAPTHETITDPRAEFLARRGPRTHRRQRTERTDPRIPARTRCEGDTGARKLAEMTAETTIVELPWWDLAEVADQDAKVFGPTAWTIRYYWSVKAQNGTAMFMARTAPAAG